MFSLMAVVSSFALKGGCEPFEPGDTTILCISDAAPPAG
jgi:hypothetical protein